MSLLLGGVLGSSAGPWEASDGRGGGLGRALDVRELLQERGVFHAYVSTSLEHKIVRGDGSQGPCVSITTTPAPWWGAVLFLPSQSLQNLSLLNFLSALKSEILRKRLFAVSLPYSSLFAAFFFFNLFI